MGLWDSGRDSTVTVGFVESSQNPVEGSDLGFRNPEPCKRTGRQGDDSCDAKARADTDIVQIRMHACMHACMHARVWLCVCAEVTGREREREIRERERERTDRFRNVLWLQLQPHLNNSIHFSLRLLLLLLLLQSVHAAKR